MLAFYEYFWWAGKNQIIGGPFQDAAGNPLANGYLLFKLQHDASLSGANTGQVLGGLPVRVPLDANGFIQGTVSGAPIKLWPNDILQPPNGTYIVYAYDSTNRRVFDNPQIQQILSSPTPFNVDAWIAGP